jgi:hypothetical protein
MVDSAFLGALREKSAAIVRTALLTALRTALRTTLHSITHCICAYYAQHCARWRVCSHNHAQVMLCISMMRSTGRVSSWKAVDGAIEWLLLLCVGRSRRRIDHSAAPHAPARPLEHARACGNQMAAPITQHSRHTIHLPHNTHTHTHHAITLSLRACSNQMAADVLASLIRTTVLNRDPLSRARVALQPTLVRRLAHSSATPDADASQVHSAEHEATALELLRVVSATIDQLHPRCIRPCRAMRMPTDAAEPPAHRRAVAR